MNDCKCQKPENLKTKPEDCTPDQIKTCHGIEVHDCGCGCGGSGKAKKTEKPEKAKK